MKKFLILLISALCITTTTTIAQNQVRGVETKVVTYRGPYYYLYEGGSTLWFGFSFYNMNSIPVSVDAKLYERYDTCVTLIDTKSFVLEPKESYIWKYENEEAFRVYEYHGNKKEKPYDNGTSYYVEYEAYKVE